jgi:hypothetical protein
LKEVHPHLKQHESTAHSMTTVALMLSEVPPAADIVTGIVYVPGLTDRMIHLSAPTAAKTTMQ